MITAKQIKNGQIFSLNNGETAKIEIRKRNDKINPNYYIVRYYDAEGYHWSSYGSCSIYHMLNDLNYELKRIF